MPDVQGMGGVGIGVEAMRMPSFAGIPCWLRRPMCVWSLPPYLRLHLPPTLSPPMPVLGVPAPLRDALSGAGCAPGGLCQQLGRSAL